MLELVSKSDLQLALDNLALRLTVRMGVMFAAGLSLTVAILGVSPPCTGIQATGQSRKSAI